MVNHPRRSKRIAVTAEPVHDHDADYAGLLAGVRATFSRTTGRPLFQTSAEGMTDLYLGNLGAERQVHTCSACRRFLENFGSLATIADDGFATSALWDADAVPDFYRPAVAAMASAVSRAKVTGVFLSSEATWGTPNTGAWTHLAVPSPAVHRHALLTAGQKMAAKREDYQTVARALADFSPELIAEALRLLEADHLARSDKFVVPLQWLADLHAKRKEAKDSRHRENLLWRAIATAPEGYCHPRSGVTGSLLEDIAAGMGFAEVKARWEAKMHPLRYQRPQAAPAVGNIAEAEKIVEKLGIARSLERRLARLEDLQTAWRPAAKKPAAPLPGGVFGHLKAKGAESVRSLDAPAAVMTWDKFTRTVLPGAEKIEALVSHGSMNFIGLTTAVHADAPPILKWDRAEARNPVAWYVYHGGSPASQWGLTPGWVDVTAITALPPMWGDNPQPHLGEGFVLVLNGAADTRTGQGNALFPECLNADLHAIRATIEAYSRRAEMQERENASACGLDVRKGSKSIGYRLRVTAAGLATEYMIDRWD